MRLVLVFSLFILQTTLMAQDFLTTTVHEAQYRFIEQGSQEGVSKDNMVLEMLLDFTVNGNKLLDIPEGTAVPMLFKDAEASKSGFMEVVATMQEGDSVEMKTSATEFFSNFLLREKPDSIPAEQEIVGQLKIVNYLTMDEYQKRAEQEQQAAMQGEINEIKKILDERGDEYTVTPGGTHIVFQNMGDGATVQAGDQVTVHYTGTLLDGTKFDSSVDRGQPFSFQVGVGRVIAGWDEGVVGQKEGTKMRLYIPSGSGYGDRGAPPTIPPNATLIFDVEVISIQ